ncbi:MAG TPA: winged helix DNA-binding domain-containing protein [Solirubrobacterales bacterium]|nr:winged helix DNA-binding domain-containing protein [Solirubrobacterales bacterium]
MLLERSEISPTEAIERLAGLQAQEPSPVFTGLWTRLADFDPAGFRRSALDRTVVRGTAMRGTLHLLTARDFPRIRPAVQDALDRTSASTGGRAEDLDLDLLISRASELLTETPRSMKDLIPLLAPDFPGADGQELRHALRVKLPMVLVPDAGDPRGWKGNAPFAVASDWIGGKPGKPLSKPDLARRYLAAFGPATPHDFGVWSGLPGVRGIFDRLRPDLITFEDERGRELFDLPEAPRPGSHVTAPARFIPAFDNLTLSHDERDRIISPEDLKLVFSPNGRIPPMFLWDGFVAGVWRNESRGKEGLLELRPFRALPPEAKDELKREGRRLLEFLEPAATRGKVRFGAKLSRR